MKADLIFADPPYDFTLDRYLKIIGFTFEKKLLNKGGQLIIEHASHTDLSKESGFCYFKKYGGSIFSFFEDAAI